MKKAMAMCQDVDYTVTGFNGRLLRCIGHTAATLVHARPLAGP